MLEERHKWLREIALKHLDLPAVFWKKVDALPALGTKIPAAVRKALEQELPRRNCPYRVARRVAGVGSLGHPRYVAVAIWDGGQLAIEAKAAIPSACAWARHAEKSGTYYQEVLDRAVRCCDPFVAMRGDWLLRRLAPDSSPIDVESMSGHRSQDNPNAS